MTLIPDESALDIRLWRHWSKAQTRITPNDAVLQLIFRAAFNQSRRKQEPHGHKESRENCVENQIEEQDPAWKEQQKLISMFTKRASASSVTKKTVASDSTAVKLITVEARQEHVQAQSEDGEGNWRKKGLSEVALRKIDSFEARCRHCIEVADGWNIN